MAVAETKKVLIVVRTYPVPAQKGVEVSCTAAITEQGDWVRLFPIPYRFLSPDQRFKKYQWVSVSVIKPRDDKRPESFRLIEDSIRILSAPLSVADNWEARKRIVLPLKKHCLCCLKRERDEKEFPTLGIFKPKIIKKLIMEPEKNTTWTQDQLNKLRQTDFFRKSPVAELEKVPYAFKYEFTCDHEGCSGHTLSCTDWEMGQSWRSWKNKYGDGWKAKFLERYETEMIEKNDTHFFVGTVHKYPENWIIVGLFYPRKELNSPQPGLFNGSSAP